MDDELYRTLLKSIPEEGTYLGELFDRMVKLNRKLMADVIYIDLIRLVGCGRDAGELHVAWEKNRQVDLITRKCQADEPAQPKPNLETE